MARAAGPVADVVQEHQLLAVGGTGNGGAVDEFEPQVRSGGQQVGDLFRVRLDSLHRFGSPAQ